MREPDGPSLNAASRCVYRTWFGPIHKLACLERWVTPEGVEYRLVECSRAR
jgi:hypothetical protein